MQSDGMAGAPAGNDAPKPDPGPVGRRPDIDELLLGTRSVDDGPPTLEELAAAAHFSRFHLSRLLRTHLGFPLRDYLAALRVERSIEALLDGQPVIHSQIEGGHESASSFTRSFARHTGLAPSRYRDQIKFLAAHLLRHMENTEPQVALYRRFSGHRQPSALTVRVEGARPDSALFAALHRSPIIRGAPDLGIAMLGTTEYTVTEIPDGTYYAMVVEVPRSAGLRALFQMDRNRRQLRRTPVTFPLAEPAEVVLALREMLPSDPPITPNIPKLFFEGLPTGVSARERNWGQVPPDAQT